MEADPSGTAPDGWLLVRIHVPELNVQKSLQFSKDQLVWDVKQQCLAALPKELKESFNYGLFCPPVNGKAGKFLDEERRLGEYPFNGPVGYLELKYKRRVYKMLRLDEKALKAVHSRANLRRFLDHVTHGQVDKVTKACAKGLDPNFHCADTGETPLTIATGLKNPGKVLIALVNGGALLDYRTKDGSTSMHRAVERNSLEAVKTLLELGASPNYKDGKGLSPLYMTTTHKTDPLLCESLLHDHATIGAQDLQGWQEVHQACRNGLVQHLDHLLFYGADMNARNASGNTPLHVCAVNGQDSCARQLLFRGCDKEALNFANQTPYQVAVIAGNLELAEAIKNFKVDEIDKSVCDTSDIISDSSGVGTSNSDTTTCSLQLPGATVVCLEPYDGAAPGHLRLCHGDLVEVSGATDEGLLEGTVRSTGAAGLFPPHCVQEVRLRQNAHNTQGAGLAGMAVASAGVGARVPGRREMAHCKTYSATAPRIKKTVCVEGSADMGMSERAGAGYGGVVRTVVLARGRRGFGFVLRGAKASSPLMELKPSARCPALQYLDDVDPGGVADTAGLAKGDFLLKINGEDVTLSSHEHVVELIRTSGALVSMTVVTLSHQGMGGGVGVAGAAGAASAGEGDTRRPYATLPRKHAAGGRAPAPPRRDPRTTLSVGRARAKSMVAGLENGGERDEGAESLGASGKSCSAESVQAAPPHAAAAPHNSSSNDGTPVAPRTASIRQRPASGRITAAELEELFQRQQDTGGMMTTSTFGESVTSPAYSPTSARVPTRVYASVAEMKRSKNKGWQKAVSTDTGSGQESGAGAATGPGPGSGALRREFHSTPDLAAFPHDKPVRVRSSEDVHGGRVPPPCHPPPPPPAAHSSHPASSFRPSDRAKLYACPADMEPVAYRQRHHHHDNTRQVRKSGSVRSWAGPGALAAGAPGSSPAPGAPRQMSADEATSPYAQPYNRQGPAQGAGPGSTQVQGAPPIPEPDYSMSESEDEEQKPPLPPAETSANSNTSGSSSGSSSMQHSFSVDEIQKIRTRLKSSKSCPDELAPERDDGDNSSSGVSSDQEARPPPTRVREKVSFCPSVTVKSSNDVISTEPVHHSSSESVSGPPPPPMQRHNSLTRKRATAAMLRGGIGSNRGKSAAERLGVDVAKAPGRRAAVSLAELPPPPEEPALVPSDVPPLAPPPQFSDRVRVVAALPKRVAHMQ